MSLTARLYIGEDKKGIIVLSCSYSFSQNVDYQGMVASDIRAGLINISIPGIDDTEILQWMLGRDALKNGKITFSGFVDTGQHRTIEFKDAYLVNYQESYSDTSDIVINLTISARIIKVKGVGHESHWAPFK